MLIEQFYSNDIITEEFNAFDDTIKSKISK